MKLIRFGAAGTEKPAIMAKDGKRRAVPDFVDWDRAFFVSERSFQLERGGQWTKGKSCDTFNPTGPWLLTADALKAGFSSLHMSLRVNGTERQRGSTATMIFGVPLLVHYVSQFMTLEAGDLISTGTPPGVGLGMNPPEYLKPGTPSNLKSMNSAFSVRSVLRVKFAQ